jgi:hypothetical protein
MYVYAIFTSWQGKEYFEVKWLGYGEEENSMLPIENLSCQLKIDEFRERQKKELVTFDERQNAFILYDHERKAELRSHESSDSKPSRRRKESAVLNPEQAVNGKAGKTGGWPERYVKAPIIGSIAFYQS